MDEKIEQLTIAADKLKEKDTDLFPDLDIMPAAGINPDAWDRHWAIVSGLAAAKESMDGVLELQYTRVPDTESDYISTTLKMGKAASLRAGSVTAFAIAAALADLISVTAIGDKVRINFLVGNVWKD